MMVPTLTSRIVSASLVAFCAILLSACSTLGAAGPSSRAINKAGGETYAAADITIVKLDNSATRQIAAYAQSSSFSEVFGDQEAGAPLIERGDVVGVTVWEAPPAVLFGVSGPARTRESTALAQSASIPDQRVNEDGSIVIPFAGKVRAAGRTPSQVQRDIVAKLRGRAHDPQVLVRLIDNQSSNVTVLGKVAITRRVPLTARGERLLDVLAAAGGPTEAVDKTTIRLTRGARAAAMPLDAIILDPAQNVPLRANDVVTVIHQPHSFVALGAFERKAEVPFEGSGITLAQALGRIGGLRDDRADIRGLFIFRLEDPAALDPAISASARRTLEGKVPVIYRLDLSDGAGFFVAQDFVMRDGDVLYVSSAPGADLQKFLSTLSNVALSTIAIGNSL